MWIQLNPQNVGGGGGGGGSEIDIFNYGNSHPKIVYSMETTNRSFTPNKDTYRIYYSSQQFTEIHVPNQRWNHFYIQYKEGSMEVYVNGTLARNVKNTDTSKLPEFALTDQVVLGNSRNVVNGAVCNITYYPIQLSNTEIYNIYRKNVDI
jgi:hypothetical protein